MDAVEVEARFIPPPVPVSDVNTMRRKHPAISFVIVTLLSLFAIAVTLSQFVVVVAEIVYNGSDPMDILTWCVLTMATGLWVGAPILFLWMISYRSRVTLALAVASTVLLGGAVYATTLEPAPISLPKQSGRVAEKSALGAASVLLERQVPGAPVRRGDKSARRDGIVVAKESLSTTTAVLATALAKGYKFTYARLGEEVSTIQQMDQAALRDRCLSYLSAAGVTASATCGLSSNSSDALVTYDGSGDKALFTFDGKVDRRD